MTADVMKDVSHETGVAQRRGPGRRVRWALWLLMTAGLLLPLIGAAVWFIESFQPLADAAGGCGGG
jgi:hypothetical protein